MRDILLSDLDEVQSTGLYLQRLILIQVPVMNHLGVSNHLIPQAPQGLDYRCVLCGILPRPTGPCRSETYKHYATCHFASELRAQYGPVGQGRMVAL